MNLRSGAAFWPIRNGLIKAYPGMTHDERADVLVIGAGITGALVAYRLTRAGASVVVVDKRDVASGSTAATTGLLQYETDTSLTELVARLGEDAAVRVWRLGLEAIDDIEQLCAETADPSGFARRPSLYLASSRRDGRRLQAEYDLRRRLGFDVEWFAPNDIEARYGFSAPGAIYGPGNAEIDCYRFTHALLAAAAAAGARVYDRTEAANIVEDIDGVTVTTDRGPTIRATRMVWAAGYEAVEETQRRVGSRHSTWAFVSEPVDNFGAWHDRALIWETARPYLYARTTDDGRVLVGGEDEPFSRRHDNDRLRPKKTRRLHARFSKMFPDIRLEAAYEWSGVFTTTSDGLPRIGEVPEHRHAWLALGYGGNGITFSAIAARLIEAAWRGEPHPDARIFAFDR